MSGKSKPGNTKQNKKEDGRFKSKHIGHNPENESARAKYGLQNTTSNGDRNAYENRG